MSPSGLLLLELLLADLICIAIVNTSLNWRIGTELNFYKKREGVKKNRQYQRASEKLERTVKRRGKGDPLEDFGTKRRSYYLSRTPIHELSDKDEIVRAGTQFQRIISANSAEEGIMSEKIKDVMYAAYEEKDKSIYYHQFGVVKQRVNAKKGDSIQQLAMQMTANKDIKIASDRKRVQTFMDLMQDDSFRDAFRKDRLSFLGKRQSAIAMWNMRTGEFEGRDWSIGNEQRSYRIFQHLLGDETSKSRKMYLDKMVGMGYNAIIDDNDANAYGRSPIVLLSASSDVVITGAQVVSEALDMIGLAKLGNIDDFLDGKK